MRKLNTAGIRQANKQLKMAASAYNLKKYLKFTQKLAQSMKKEARATFAPFYPVHTSDFKHLQALRVLEVKKL